MVYVIFCVLIGPIPKTTVDFWRLIWQEKPPIIVMVTNLKEGNKSKCEQYWPDSGTKNFGPFKVTLTEHQVFADYCIRTMQVTVSVHPLLTNSSPFPWLNEHPLIQRDSFSRKGQCAPILFPAALLFVAIKGTLYSVNALYFNPLKCGHLCIKIFK